MADTLSIDSRVSVQVKTNDTLSTICEWSDLEAAGTQIAQFTLKLAPGANNTLIPMPTNLLTVGKYLIVTSDIPILLGSGVTDRFATTFAFVRLESPLYVAFYVSNSNGTTATLVITLVG